MSLNTPFSINWYYWIWGLTSYRYASLDPFDPNVLDVTFTDNTTLFMFSIISMITLAIGLILLLIVGITSKKNIRYSKKLMVINGLSVILLIAGGIVIWLGADWPTTTHSIPYLLGTSALDFYSASFGFYSPFIGAGIAVLGIPLHYY
ncbi:unnamed protein product, partial [marine sediment metagenome]